MTTIAFSTSSFSPAKAALYAHWKIYAIEAVLLGSFMVSACAFTVLLEYPGSPVAQNMPSPFARRMLIGIALALTATTLIYSNWGKQSGAHMNPAITACFLRLGQMAPWDAVFYIIAQFIGGILGVVLCRVLAKPLIIHPSVNYVVTLPGPYGVVAAWFAEFGMALALMATILGVNRFPGLIKRAGFFAGGLIALYVTFEAPVSGASINSARTLGSARVAELFTGIWIYFTAPVAGMLTAVEIHRFLSRQPHRLCCKLTHSRKIPCLIRCNCLADAGIEHDDG
jgi:aquaporin Z